MSDDEDFEALVSGLPKETPDQAVIEALKGVIQRHGANWDEMAPWGLIQELMAILLQVDEEDVAVLLQAFHRNAKEVADGMVHNWAASKSVPAEKRAAAVFMENIEQVYRAANSVELIPEMDYATDRWLSMDDVVLSVEQRAAAIARIHEVQAMLTQLLKDLSP